MARSETMDGTDLRLVVCVLRFGRGQGSLPLLIRSRVAIMTLTNTILLVVTVFNMLP